MRVPWSKKSGGPASPEAQVGTAPKERDPAARIAIWVGILVGVITIGSAGYKLATVLESKAPLEVEVSEPAIFNPTDLDESPGRTEPEVTATVRNVGKHTAYVDEARITVYDDTRIGICFTQGGGPDIPHSKPYRVTMPEFPTATKKIIHEHLHVEVKPDSGARPLLKFQKRFTATSGLYAIDVSYLVEPGEEILDAGRFVIGVPAPPRRGGYYLPEDETALTGEGFWHGIDDIPPNVTACLRHNLEGVQRVAADPGLRSADVRALSDLQSAPAWPGIVKREPTHEEIDALFGSYQPEGAIWAVELAATTGDDGYEEDVRRRAMAKLDRTVEGDLKQAGSTDIELAEEALSIEASKAGEDLLARTKVAAEEQEERVQEELKAQEASVASDAGE